MIGELKNDVTTPLPAPTRWFNRTDVHGRYMHVPVWSTDLLGGINPWSGGVAIGADFRADATAEQVQAAGLALLAVAKHMRESADSSKKESSHA